MGALIPKIAFSVLEASRNFLCYSRSIKAKIFLTFTCVVLLSISVITLSTYFNFSRTIEKNAVIYVSDAIRHANENFDMIFQDIDKISTAIAINANQLLSAVPGKDISVTYEGFLEAKNSEMFLSTLMANKPYISRIAVIGFDGKIFQTGGPKLFNSILNTPWFEQARNESDVKQIWIDVTEQGSIAYSRVLRLNNIPIGLLLIDFNKTFIEKVYSIKPVEGSQLFVSDSFGNLIVRSKSEDQNDSAINSAVHVLQQLNHIPTVNDQSISYPMVEADRQKYLGVHFRSSVTGWTTFGLIPYDSLMHEAIAIRNNIIKMVSIVFLLVFIVSIVISNQITVNLKRLSHTMQKVRQGHLDARPRIRSKDEIGGLSEVFDLMMTRIHELMEESKNREQEKRKAELAALQSQIKPHFIYNTLGTIKNLARIHHVRNIEELIGSFIDLLRITVGHTRETITIRQELDYLNSYIQIQKYKYLDRVIVKFQVEEDLLELRTLKLLLQPILENSMIHGMGDSNKNLLITIRIYKEPHGIKFEITDNGAGISAEMIESILYPSAENNRKSGGMGLQNVNARLKGTFGNEYGLSIVSEPGMYTTVEFLIPAKELEGN